MFGSKPPAAGEIKSTSGVVKSANNRPVQYVQATLGAVQALRLLDLEEHFVNDGCCTDEIKLRQSLTAATRIAALRLP